ncbi:hypothetical protein M413DRAFT_112354 [Hebeloma cylindrosporum]|uniref:Uncharacterized protein n=1 Tax=Hebeloma cylindrosporum TaxID=76867 RepID=A0A0C3D0I5_HEBCY|nr:hypothetical protein M413DRAFT_112354 [Hebeloma cylindrosporum h7]
MFRRSIMELRISGEMTKGWTTLGEAMQSRELCAVFDDMFTTLAMALPLISPTSNFARFEGLPASPTGDGTFRFATPDFFSAWVGVMEALSSCLFCVPQKCQIFKHYHSEWTPPYLTSWLMQTLQTSTGDVCDVYPLSRLVGNGGDNITPVASSVRWLPPLFR